MKFGRNRTVFASTAIAFLFSAFSTSALAETNVDFLREIAEGGVNSNLVFDIPSDTVQTGASEPTKKEVCTVSAEINTVAYQNGVSLNISKGLGAGGSVFIPYDSQSIQTVTSEGVTRLIYTSVVPMWFTKKRDDLCQERKGTAPGPSAEVKFALAGQGFQMKEQSTVLYIGPDQQILGIRIERRILDLNTGNVSEEGEVLSCGDVSESVQDLAILSAVENTGSVMTLDPPGLYKQIALNNQGVEVGEIYIGSIQPDMDRSTIQGIQITIENEDESKKTLMVGGKQSGRLTIQPFGSGYILVDRRIGSRPNLRNNVTSAENICLKDRPRPNAVGQNFVNMSSATDFTYRTTVLVLDHAFHIREIQAHSWMVSMQTGQTGRMTPNWSIVSGESDDSIMEPRPNS